MQTGQRWVIITGHSAGLGRALAAHYLAAGDAVWGLSRRVWPQAVGGLRQTALDLADSAALADWLTQPAWRQTVAAAAEILLINNAAVVTPNALAGRAEAADIMAAVALNLTAPVLLSNALLRDAAPGCLKTIVHISSGAGRKAYAGWSVYGATKAALDQHAAVLAAEGHPHLRVASIAPGVVDTAMQAQIRAASAAEFPLQPQFVALAGSGGLQTAEQTAAALAAMMAAADFGRAVCRDVREQG